MNNRTALVTGGASGLGLAIAQKLVTEGYHTIVIGRNENKLLQAKEQLGSNCSIYPFDLTDLQHLPDLVERLYQAHEKIDVLVNNAGIHLKKPALEVSDAEFQQVITTNLTAVFCLSREIAKRMLPQSGGSIINISSMAAIYGIPQVIAYTAAKSGIEGMTRAMAVEWSAHGIRVNCIAPGFIATNMSSKAMDNDPERKQKVLSRTPMGAFGRPEDVAEAACFLASEASGFITGTVLPVDGGNAIGF